MNIDDYSNEIYLIEPIVNYTKTQANNVTIFDSVNSDKKGELKINYRKGDGNAIYYGFACKVNRSKVLVAGSNNTIIVGPYADLENVDVRLVGDNNILVIGAFTSIGGATFFLKGENRIQIASCCVFSTGIIIDASDHHAIYDLKSGLKINPDSDVDISKKVWIGRNVSITKGTSIGSQSIIGQGSICSGALKCNSVYAGAPIRMIKENVTWSRMNANSISEMKNSDRHINWLKKYEEVQKIVGTSIDI